MSVHFDMEKFLYVNNVTCHHNQQSSLKIANLSTVNTAYENFELALAEGKPREARDQRHPARALQHLSRRLTLQRAVMRGQQQSVAASQ
jgi:hypothetical protein